MAKGWHLNTLNEPTVGSNSYQASAAGSTLFGTTILPQNAATREAATLQRVEQRVE